MVLSVKCLPCKHRDLSLDPQHPHKCQEWQQVSVSAALSRQEPQSLLASQSIFRYLKPEEHLMLTSGFHTHVHTHKHTHTNQGRPVSLKLAVTCVLSLPSECSPIRISSIT